MKRLSLIALALATTAISFAQNTDYTPTNLAFRLGFAYPLNDTTRDLSKRFIGVGADYYFPTQFIRGSQTYLSIDWLGKSGNGAKGNVFPIMLNQKFYGRNQEEGRANSYGFFSGKTCVSSGYGSCHWCDERRFVAEARWSEPV